MRALADEVNIKAYYQPILALDSRMIIGYEVLGRVSCDHVVRSLGPYFTHPDVASEDQLRVDILVRKGAFAKIAQAGTETMLFINIKPSWMYQAVQQDKDFLTLRLLDTFGIDPHQIVIEITEDSFRGSASQLERFVDRYREKGCLIAIDDIGTGFSNMDRIVQVRPNIIKADINMMKKSAANYSYFGALRSFSMLAEQIGSSFLIEGVETVDDLRRAIAIGARYVQGFLFSPAASDFQTAERFSPIIEESMSQYRIHLLQNERGWAVFCQALVDALDLSEQGSFPLLPNQRYDELRLLADNYLTPLLSRLNAACTCTYICNPEGLQISSNFVHAGDQWIRKQQYQGINWCWRPHFVLSLLARSSGKLSSLSQMYIDLETKKNVRTFSLTLRNGALLFIDIDVSAVQNERPDGFLTTSES